MINCPNCSAQVPAGAAFCDNCGTSLAGVAARPGAGASGGFASPGFGASGPGPAAGQGRCPNCGESVMPGEAFCGNCGTPLSTAAPTAFVPPPAPSAPSWPPPPAPPAPSAPSWSPPPAPPAPSAPSWSPPPAPANPPPPPISPARDWAEPAAPPAADSACPNCGAAIQPGDVFCDNCGQALTPKSGFPSGQQAPALFTSDPSLPLVSTPPAGMGVPVLNPRLVVPSSGATLNLAPGKTEYLIGREDPVSGSFPDVDLVPYGGEEGGVSRRHAQITSRGGQFVIEDLNSVNYTFVNRQKVAPGTPHPLRDGDEIRLGRVVLQFKTS